MQDAQFDDLIRFRRKFYTDVYIILASRRYRVIT